MYIYTYIYLLTYIHTYIHTHTHTSYVVNICVSLSSFRVDVMMTGIEQNYQVSRILTAHSLTVHNNCVQTLLILSEMLSFSVFEYLYTLAVQRVWNSSTGSFPVWRTGIPNNTRTYYPSVPEWFTCHRKIRCCVEETHPKRTLGTEQWWCCTTG